MKVGIIGGCRCGAVDVAVSHLTREVDLHEAVHRERIDGRVVALAAWTDRITEKLSIHRVARSERCGRVVPQPRNVVLEGRARTATPCKAAVRQAPDVTGVFR